MCGQGAVLVAGPGLQRRDELALVHQAVVRASIPRSRSRSAAAMAQSSWTSGALVDQAPTTGGFARAETRIDWIIA